MQVGSDCAVALKVLLKRAFVQRSTSAKTGCKELAVYLNAKQCVMGTQGFFFALMCLQVFACTKTSCQSFNISSITVCLVCELLNLFLLKLFLVPVIAYLIAQDLK